LMQAVFSNSIVTSYQVPSAASIHSSSPPFRRSPPLPRTPTSSTPTDCDLQLSRRNQMRILITNVDETQMVARTLFKTGGKSRNSRTVACFIFNISLDY
jgi:hypothetical protein